MKVVFVMVVNVIMACVQDEQGRVKIKDVWQVDTVSGYDIVKSLWHRHSKD
jgi:hypothetical protein